MDDIRIHRRVIDMLYIDAMVLADEARSYFDDSGQDDRAGLDPIARVSFSCESLKMTTRLMHVIAWLLTQRAVDVGEMKARGVLDPSRRLGTAPTSDPAALAVLPAAAQRLIAASDNLHRRVARLDHTQSVETVTAESPVHSLRSLLARAF